MYGDFSRFDAPTNTDYDGVWFQQGRVQLDADHNKQAAIVRDWLRTLTQDMIGPFGGSGAGAGFEVTRDLNDDLVVGPGHYYVYGARCQLRPAADGQPITLDRLTDGRLLPGALKPPFVMHLQVWDETVNAVADPRLIEPALGPNPPDTTIRSRTAWRVQIQRKPSWISNPPQEEDGTPKPPRQWVNEVYDSWSRPTDRPRLRVRVSDSGRREASVISPSAGYRGAENQLYRVEIHRPTTSGRTGGETFKWSRDNGSVMFAIESTAKGKDTAEGKTTVLTVNSLGRDATSTLKPGDWVEVIDRTWSPFGEPGPLLQVHRVDPVTREVTVPGDISVVSSQPPAPRPLLRRWDQNQDSGDGDGIPVKAPADAPDEGWIELEDGVEVQFPLAKARYRRGDYWLIPARTANGVQWPGGPENPAAIEPWGPQRRYAPLALVTDQGVVTDLRTLFVPLAFPDDTPLPALPPHEPATAGTTGGAANPTVPPPIPDDSPPPPPAPSPVEDGHG